MPTREPDPVADLLAEFVSQFPNTPKARVLALEFRIRDRWGGQRIYFRKAAARVVVGPAEPGGQSNC